MLKGISERVSLREFIELSKSGNGVRDVVVDFDKELTADVFGAMKLSKKVYENVSFYGLELRVSIFNDCSFNGCAFYNCLFEGVNLINSRMSNCTFVNSKIAKCSVEKGLCDIHMVNSAVLNVDIKSSRGSFNISSSCISNSCLSESDVSVSLVKCNVDGCAFDKSRLAVICIAGGSIGACSIVESEASGGSVNNVSVSSLLISDSKVESHIVTGCLVSKLRISDCHISDVCANSNNLSDVQIEKTRAERVRLYKNCILKLNTHKLFGRDIAEFCNSFMG